MRHILILQVLIKEEALGAYKASVAWGKTYQGAQSVQIKRLRSGRGDEVTERYGASSHDGVAKSLNWWLVILSTCRSSRTTAAT